MAAGAACQHTDPSRKGALMSRFNFVYIWLFVVSCGATACGAQWSLPAQSAPPGTEGGVCTDGVCAAGLYCVNERCAASSSLNGGCNEQWPCRAGLGLVCKNQLCVKAADGDAESDVPDTEPEMSETAEREAESDNADNVTTDGDGPDSEFEAESRETEEDALDQQDGDSADQPPADLICQNGVCQDPATGLEWQEFPGDTKINGTSALTYCTALDLKGSGWRLPNISELRSLVRNCENTQIDGLCGVLDTSSACGVPASCLDSHCNNSALCAPASCPTKARCYWPQELSGDCAAFWSSSDQDDMPGVAWIVDFENAALLTSTRCEESYCSSDYSYVRCVRGQGTPRDCVSVLADAPQNGRYTCCGGVCTDPASGIEWQQTPNFPVGPLYSEFDHCDTLSLMGDGWRVPSLKELQLLLPIADGAQGSYCAWPDPLRGPCTAYCTNEKVDTSATSDWRWCLNFPDGQVVQVSPSNGTMYPVRCVRNGPDFCSPWSSAVCKDGDAYNQNCRQQPTSLLEDCAACPCANGACVTDYQHCFEGDVYHYDCQGNRLEKVLACGSAPCTESYCDPEVTWISISGNAAQPSFEMTDTKITLGQYKIAMGENPNESSTCGDNCPVSVNFQQASSFCGTIGGRRLATNAEWEYAAQAGASTDYICGDDATCLSAYAWCDGNKHPVKQKTPNAWGLYDIIGNGEEWVNGYHTEHHTGVDFPFTNARGRCGEPTATIDDVALYLEPVELEFRCVR